MLTIKKTSEGKYFVTLPDETFELERSNAYYLKKDLLAIIRPYKEISIDIRGVKTINNGGYKILQELMNTARTKRCSIYFLNVDPSIAGRIANLTEMQRKHQHELELD